MIAESPQVDNICPKCHKPGMKFACIIRGGKNQPSKVIEKCPFCGERRELVPYE